MKPYYSHAGIEIYLGDCREILPTLPKVDLVLTDPPYGIALSNHAAGKQRSLRDWSIIGDDSQDAGKAAPALLCDMPTIAFASAMKPWPGKWRQHLVWDKGPNAGFGGDPERCWMLSWELIQVRNNGPLNGKRQPSIIRFAPVQSEYKDHPTPKPEALMRYLVGKATKEGDIILDPFMGSGTTLVAAKNLNRRAIGIEIEERYCEIAAKRLSQEVLDLGGAA